MIKMQKYINVLNALHIPFIGKEVIRFTYKNNIYKVESVMGAIRVKRNSENLYAENADEFLNILIQR
jgi:hypothetical protein